MTTAPPDGVFDEALERLHAWGPERLGHLSNHAPMVVEALASRGRSRSVHRWLDTYAHKLEEQPAAVERLTEHTWPEALGDYRRIGDWVTYLRQALEEEHWTAVLVTWWPRLLTGLYGASTHPVIRVGHTVRALSLFEESAPRRTELAHALGYWAARYRPVTGVRLMTSPAGADAALEAVPALREPTGGFTDRLGDVRQLPDWTSDITEPTAARDRLTETVRAAVHRYATHGHGDAVMLVHAATAPNAVLRTLDVLPRDQWVPSLHAAWRAAAAVTAMYAPSEPRAYVPPGTVTAGDVLERAVAHGDEHVIKFTDTALDIGDERALAAALRAVELGESAQ